MSASLTPEVVCVSPVLFSARGMWGGGLGAGRRGSGSLMVLACALHLSPPACRETFLP